MTWGSSYNLSGQFCHFMHNPLKSSLEGVHFDRDVWRHCSPIEKLLPCQSPRKLCSNAISSFAIPSHWNVQTARAEEEIAYPIWVPNSHCHQDWICAEPINWWLNAPLAYQCQFECFILTHIRPPRSMRSKRRSPSSCNRCIYNFGALGTCNAEQENTCAFLSSFSCNCCSRSRNYGVAKH